MYKQYKIGDMVWWNEAGIGILFGVVLDNQTDYLGVDYDHMYTVETVHGLFSIFSSRITNSCDLEEIFPMVLTALSKRIHNKNIEAGWWHDPETGQSLKEGPVAKYAMFAKLFLVHSEVSEGGEGLRKNLKDDHLPHRDMAEVEFGDTLIRLLDCSAAKNYDIGAAVKEKMEYNAHRADHKIENRQKEGGKSL